MLVLILIAMMPLAGWGWARWIMEREGSYWPSLTGFGLASVSILMAFCAGLYAEIVGGFRHYDPKLLRIFGAGMALSVIGLGFSIMGLRQRNPVQWHAVGCSLGMIAFWFLSAMME
jgi:hypothetical protein